MELVTLKDNERFLRQKSEEIVIVDDQLKREIREVGDYCRKNAVFAMAAVQLGVPKRFVYVKNSSTDVSKNFDKNYNEAKVLINPEIVEAEGETYYWECCKSCPLTGWVRRPYKMKVRYCDLNCEYHFEEFEGFICTVLCHEIDHLDGILHVDRTDNIRVISLEERLALREREPYKIVSKEGKFSYNKPEKKLSR